MATRNKLEKFAENLGFPNVFENFDPKSDELRGLNGVSIDHSKGWNSFFFDSNKLIVLELACGRGEYSLALAHMNPNINYIGVDIKGARIWKGAKNALKRNLTNVAFLRTRIENIESFFRPGEVSEIWITFPDPFLKKSKSNRRLTSPAFLQRYRNIMKKGGIVHLKTDSDELYEFTMEVLDRDKNINILYRNEDIYADIPEFAELHIKTYYENQHLAERKKIKYIKFTLD
jgi:tRNA (guanine-N7-)-methyltransferase